MRDVLPAVRVPDWHRVLAEWAARNRGVGLTEWIRQTTANEIERTLVEAVERRPRRPDVGGWFRWE